MAGIYIHIPFCKQACFYCDFHFSTSLKKKEALLGALVKELELRRDIFENVPIETIYFGGGTPSLLSQREIEHLINTVYQNYQVSINPEITLEANPDDLTTSKLKDLSKSPVNRLSIGVQSFFEHDLKLMNRAHNTTEAKQCLEEATKYFENISLDLIYGIPDASNAQWEQNIETALAFNIPHISSYALTVEPNTALASFIKKGLIKNVDDAQSQEQFHILIALLESAGFVHYETSNFGKPNFFSRNNTAYWQGKSFLGIGPSAHSFYDNQRTWNVRNNSKYINSLEEGVLPMEVETLTKTDTYNEYIMTGLRTIWGVSLEKVLTDFGPMYKTYLLNQAEKYIDQGLIYVKEDTLLATNEGKFLTDGIAADLFKLNL
ncbi:radical SAM family heme chaperone HemW [Gaetbulibacter sp. M240]|uniref:radical SAM family heme chaperone HemW n=1 Tax=Gaetbulibacter sp. M240 TaxID=3126511 RepID=UPI00374E59A2